MGEWEVRRSEGILSRGDDSARLEPRVMDVLAYLAASPGRVVSKDELLQEVWRGAFVEEGALSQAIHSLRKALRDDARQPLYIQTVPKRGYCLVAPVEPLSNPSPAIQPPEPDAPPISPEPARPASRRGWVWLLIVVTGLATILGLVLLDRGQVGEARATAPSPGDSRGVFPEGEMRIVVLPFEDLGPPGDPFFSPGLTQEVTKDLGSLPSLQVIYRAISAQKGTKPPSEIGKELGVGYVLVGTVQWAPRSEGRLRVRIRPQLIRVDGVQVWADSFESEVKDVFEVQSEISRQVISSLGINLLPEQSQALQEPSTKKLEAYQAYVRGLSLKDQPFYSEEHLRKAALSFERAVEVDPGFAPAWAELSMADSYLAYNTDPTPKRIEQARQALERAVALAPDLPEVRLARAYFAYRCQEDFDGALAQLDAAAKLFPNNAEVSKAYGLLLRRKGRLGDAIKALRHAEWLNPRIGELTWILAETQRALRNFKEADRGFAQAISQAPDEPFFWEQRVLNRLALTGDPEAARALLDQADLSGDPLIKATAFRLDLYEGKYQRALDGLSPDWLGQLAPETQTRIALMAAVARERMGDHRGALAAAEANRADLLEKIARYPHRGFLHACLAVALAQLGRSEEALAQIQQAAEMRQTDAFSGPRIGEVQALVDVILGRHQEATGRLARQLAAPYRNSLTVTDLRLDPAWEPLRGEVAFEALLRRQPMVN